MANGSPSPYGTLRYVDTVNGNFLFRGGAAITTGPDGQPVFDYDGLTSAIAAAPNLPPTPPLPPSSSYYLVVVNLEHSNEGTNLTAETNYFSNPPGQQSVGQMQFWDTYGTALCYFEIPDPQLLTATLGEWLPDPLIWRVATLRSWLEDPALNLPLQPLPDPAQPIVVYVHCDGGCDRTSEMIGAYRLRYMPASWTMETAWSNMCNEHPCVNVMGCNNYRAVEWYAQWLNLTQGFSLTGIGQNDGGCNNGNQGGVGAWCW
jgi:hypothetical protein